MKWRTSHLLNFAGVGGGGGAAFMANGFSVRNIASVLCDLLQVRPCIVCHYIFESKHSFIHRFANHQPYWMLSHLIWLPPHSELALLLPSFHFLFGTE